MSKYKILWNDDEADKYASRPELQEYPEFVFEFERYQDICLQKLKENADQYDAVILDANGISSKHPEILPNKGEYFHTLVDKACENKRLRTFVFSGQLHFDSSDPNESGVNNFLTEKGFIKGKNLFPKTMFEEMLEQLRDDLDEYNAWGKYYDGNEFLLDLVHKGWISKEDREEHLDTIMKVYSERDVITGVGNNFRHLLQDLLDVINDKFLLFDRGEDEDGHYGSIIQALSKQKTIPASLIIGPMWAIHNISNSRSHVSLDPHDRELYFDSSFSSFFLVARWFYRLMTEPIGYESIKNPIRQKNKYPGNGVILPVRKDGDKAFCDIRIQLPKALMQEQYIDVVSISPTWHLYFKNKDNYVFKRITLAGGSQKPFIRIPIQLPEHMIDEKTVTITGIGVNDSGEFFPKFYTEE